MINGVGEFLDARGLVTAEQIAIKVSNCNNRNLATLRDDLYGVIYENRLERETDDFNLFNFYASASFRGDRCCVMPGCRIKKIPRLAKFAALYCDRVVLPLRFGARSGSDRDIVHGNLLILSELRPLIDEGIVVPVPDVPCLCKEHAAEYEGVRQKIRSLTGPLIRNRSELFTVYCIRYGRKVSLELQGPPEIVENGVQHWMYYKEPAWAVDLPPDKKVKLDPGFVAQHELLRTLFTPNEFDVLFQQGLTGSGCTYLTDNVAEEEYFTAARSDNSLASKVNAVCAELGHSVPMFRDIPVATALRLRRQEAESFLTYRNALNRAVGEAVSQSKTGVVNGKELFDDVLLPQLNKLRSKEREARRAKLRKLGANLAASGAALFIGVISGDHMGLGSLLGAVGGVSFLQQVAGHLSEAGKLSPEVATDDFSFLFRMQGELMKRGRASGASHL